METLTRFVRSIGAVAEFIIELLLGELLGSILAFDHIGLIVTLICQPEQSKQQAILFPMKKGDRGKEKRGIEPGTSAIEESTLRGDSQQLAGRKGGESADPQQAEARDRDRNTDAMGPHRSPVSGYTSSLPRCCWESTTAAAAAAERDRLGLINKPHPTETRRSSSAQHLLGEILAVDFFDDPTWCGFRLVVFIVNAKRVAYPQISYLFYHRLFL